MAIAYIVNVLAKRKQKTKRNTQPKDRMEQMFDGYERLIKQKDVEDDRKVKVMRVLEDELAMTKVHVANLEKALATTQHELEVSLRENKELKHLLAEMRKEYKEVKHKET